jgi:GNAT superfamily N-acetyltransferase
MNLNIRTAGLEDLSLLIQLYADMDGEPPLPNSVAEDIFAAIIRIPDYFIYIAFQDKKPVGTFSLIYVTTMMHRGYHRYAVLDAVTVYSKLRGQGIGTEMVKAALKLSAKAGCYKLMLSSNLKREQSHDFYKSLGFEQHGWSFKCVAQPSSI